MVRTDEGGEKERCLEASKSTAALMLETFPDGLGAGDAGAGSTAIGGDMMLVLEVNKAVSLYSLKTCR